MDFEYGVKESSNFRKYYKNVLKKYRHSFEQDFADVIKVITKKLILEQGKFLNIPQTEVIRDLGDKVTHPIAKTRVQIKQAQRMCGRVIYLVDRDKKRIFLIDIYYKSEKENPDKAIIAKAYYEYLELLDQEKNSVSS